MISRTLLHSIKSFYIQTFFPYLLTGGAVVAADLHMILTALRIGKRIEVVHSDRSRCLHT